MYKRQSYTRKTNSLFRYAEGTPAGTALIAYGRHLQNLDEASHVSDTITRAVQVSDLSFADDTADNEDWYSFYRDDTFTPVSYTHLQEQLEEALTIQKQKKERLGDCLLYTSKDFGSIGITGVFQADAWQRAFTGSELGGIFSAIMLLSLIHISNWEALKAYYKNVLAKIADGSVLSAHVVKEGGAAAAVAKMAFGNKLGFKFEKTAENAELLFAPKAGALVVEVPADALESVKNTFDAVVLGTVTDTAKIELNGKALDLDDLIETWNGKLEKIFANKAETVAVEYDVPLDNHKYTGSPVIRVAKPKVFIPRCV